MKPLFPVVGSAFATLLLSAAAPCPAAEPFSDLVRRLPEGANAVLLIDAAALRRSEYGTRMGWAKNHQQDSLGHAESLPAFVERMVIAGDINPTTLKPVWRASVAASNEPITPAQLTQAEGGTLDAIAGHSVILSPRHAYYTTLAPQVVGSLYPANRQALGRWLRATGGGRDHLSPYLQSALAAPAAPIVLAFDLTDLFDPPGLRGKLAKSPALAGRTADLARVTAAVAGLKGASRSVRAGAKLECELRLEGTDAATLAPVAKGLVLEALSATGGAVGDAESWTARQDGTAVVLSGPVTEAGLRLLLSPLLSPAMTSAAGPGTAAPSGRPDVAASQKYFRSVNKLIHDLKQLKASTYSVLSRNYQNYAQQMDELPILGVDPELLKWGSDVAATLRGLASLGKATQNQQAIISAQRMTVEQTVGGGFNASDAWGYVYNVPTTATVATSNDMQVNNLMATTGANERVIRSKTWENIDNATAQVRRKMTDKYKVEF